MSERRGMEQEKRRLEEMRMQRAQNGKYGQEISAGDYAAAFGMPGQEMGQKYEVGALDAMGPLGSMMGGMNGMSGKPQMQGPGIPGMPSDNRLQDQMPVSFTGGGAGGMEQQVKYDEKTGKQIGGPGMTGTQVKMTKERLQKGIDKLVKYISDKGPNDERLVADEKWWERRAWNYQQDKMNPFDARRGTNWLFNVIMGKHADMLEAFPEPVILPREQGDAEEAKQLTEIVPVVLEQNDFDQVYALQAWEKNKHGTAVYGIFWDSKKLNGLGDVAVEKIDVLNIFWEKGVEDIQDSENVFVIKAISKDKLRQMYPDVDDRQIAGPFAIKQYNNENRDSLSDKAMLVDWYYKTYDTGKPVLQYCKFVGEQVLYASEDDPQVGADGWYTDGEYPFVVDALFPIKGNICGQGFIDLGKNAQEGIDLMDQAMTMNALAGAIPRWLVTDDTNVNEKEFADFRNHFIHVTGASQNGLQPIQCASLSATHVSIMNNKIEELKQTTGNQDVSNGVAGSVTAASGIAALQESAGRSSKDSIRGTYRAYARIVEKVIERIRQFYDTPRAFRILGRGAQMDFVTYSNTGIKAQMMPPVAGVEMGMRLPVFDVTVNAQKSTSYSKLAQNELAFQLLNAGVFNLQMADQSLMLLDMMDFKDKDKLMGKIQEGQTMQQHMAMWQQMALNLAQKYEPETAQQMAQTLMMMGGQQPMPVEGQMSAPADEQKEAGFMQRVRAQAQNSSQPE